MFDFDFIGDLDDESPQEKAQWAMDALKTLDLDGYSWAERVAITAAIEVLRRKSK